MSTNKLRYPELDVLKTIGFVMVFLVHYNQMFSGVFSVLNRILMYGQMGCQIFLMVTGFLFAASYEQNAIMSMRAYLQKKLIGLAPGYYLAFVVYAILYMLFMLVYGAAPFRADYSLLGAVCNLTFLHGIMPFCNNVIVPGGWYVGTLMLFYFILPVVYPYLRERVYAYRIAPVVSCIISLAISCVIGKIDPSLVGNNSFFYYSFVCQAPAVLMGVILYYEKEKILKMSAWLDLSTFAVFALLTLGILAIGNDLLVPTIPLTAALSYVGLYGLVCKLIKKKKLVILQDIGKASYGCYLFHFIFAWFVPYAIREMEVISSEVLFAVLLLPCLGISCVLGSAATKLLSTVSKKLHSRR